MPTVDTVMLNKIMAAIGQVPMSATAIAKAAGYSKAHQIADGLSALVNDGRLSIDNSGRFPVYSKNTAVTTASDELDMTEDDEDEEVTVIHNNSSSSVRTVNEPVVNADDLSSLEEINGYTVEHNVKNSAGQICNRITFPDGRKCIILADSSLIVINDNSIFSASKPVGVISAIAKWTSDHGMRTFAVRQMNVGGIKKPTDVKMVPVIILTIVAVNKAAM